MSNISKLEFVALDISGKGYSSWILDGEIHLDAMGLVDTIKDNNQASIQERAKAMIFLRHHLDEGLKMQYLTIKEPLILWNNLKDRYDHLKLVILPQARHDWFNLRLLDFKSNTEYNSSMYRIISQLNLCGEDVTEHDKLEKIYSTLPTSVNQANYHQQERGRGSYRGCGSGHGCCRKINYNHDGRLAPKNDQQHKRKGERQEVIQKENSESASLKKGDNNPEANFISKEKVEPIHKMNNNAEANFISEDNVEPMHLDVADFFVFPEGKTISDDPAII
ncbi:hypothetical protein KY284_020482 [Solanum tuberosum]|nr:hypothetical protein KY284_020482 [Solanum tuberosum]